MSPPPPPGPPPPPTPSKGGKPWGKKIGAGRTDRSALLQSIQQGKGLKKTVTNDRSVPMVGASKTSNKRQGPPNLNGERKFPADGGGRSNNFKTETNDSNENPKSPPIGSLFAGGMPQLQTAGDSGINTGRITTGILCTKQLSITISFFFTGIFASVSKYCFCFKIQIVDPHPYPKKKDSVGIVPCHKT